MALFGFRNAMKAYLCNNVRIRRFLGLEMIAFFVIFDRPRVGVIPRQVSRSRNPTSSDLAQILHTCLLAQNRNF